MIYRHTPQQVQQYYDTIGVNQSAIKVLINEGIESFLMKRDELQTTNELYYEEKAHFLIGSAVDAFFSYGKEGFDLLYARSTMQRKPPDKPMAIVRMVFDKACESGDVRDSLASYTEDLYHAADVHSYYMNRRIPSDKPVKCELVDVLGQKQKDVKGKVITIMGPDTRSWTEDNRIQNMLADGLCQTYWLELKNSIGKQLLSDEEAQVIDAVIISMSTHPHTAYLFSENMPETIDVIFQMPLYFELMDTTCKGMVDLIVIDHESKLIAPIDNKTLGRYVTKFAQEFRYRRYDIQGAFYKKGISLSLTAISELIGKDVSTYSIADFAFVVESTLKPGTPLMYLMTEEVEKEGISGDGEDLLGYEQGLQLLKEWEQVDFSITKKFEETNGLIRLEKNYHKIKI